MSKRIYLTQGKFTLVSDEDYEQLTRFKWCYNKYATTSMRIAGKRVHRAMHQIILVAPPGLEIDHINRNKLDNRRCNLRIVTRSENMKNKAPRPKKPTLLRNPKVGRSGVLGVTWRSKRQMWIAAYQRGKRRAYLGAYSTVQEATAVLLAYKLQLAAEREALTITEVAALLQVSRQEILHCCKCFELPKTGNRYSITKQDIEKMQMTLQRGRSV